MPTPTTTTSGTTPATGHRGEYEHHRPYSPGETVTLPGPIGAEVTLGVDQILKAAQKKAS
ncbi:hypothetical protein [Streptomyces sp. NPDC059224]|uniref:hypothetical protein n=1 Tax=Streptomyces sp. NPDC059224 TaxID=3346775 RepID=UPI0036A1263F